MRIGAIVEGHGEVSAVPILLRRLGRWLDPTLELDVATLRLSRGRLVKEEEFRRAVELVARKVGPQGPILVLLDADDDPACQLGPQLVQRARAVRSDRDIAVVVAVREYEAWFLAAAESLAGRRGLPADLRPPPDPEARGSPKGWIHARMPDGYSEALDQPALTEAMDLIAARGADSFDKLVRDVARLLQRDAPPRIPHTTL